MIRTILTPENTNIHLSIPKDYIGRKIEVMYYPVDELVEEAGSAKVKTMADLWNTISDATAHSLHQQIEQSRKEWERDI